MTGLYAVADFCLIPMGTGETSVGKYIAECQRVLEKSGLQYEMHGYGTNLEGSFSAVSAAIEACHEAVHAIGAPRIATDIRIGTRTDRPAHADAAWAEGLTENQRKAESVRQLLAKSREASTSAGQGQT